MSINTRIKELRKNHKMTQPQLADKLGVSLDMVKSLEIGRSNPSIDTLNKLADVFECSTDYLMGRTDAPQEEKPITWPEMNKVLYDFVELADKYNAKVAKDFKELFDTFPKEDRVATEEEQEKYERILDPLTKSLQKILKERDERETPD